jgi:hypothetical protein
VKKTLLRCFAYLFLFAIGLLSGSWLPSMIAFIVFCFDFYHLSHERYNSFMSYIVVNVGILFFIFSCLIIDIFPNIYLYEIDKISSFESITPLAIFYLWPVICIVNYQYKENRFFQKIPSLPSSMNGVYEKVIWIFFLIVVFLIFELFQKKGLPIFEGIHRVTFLNRLSSWELVLYTFLSFCSALFGYLNSQTNSKSNFIALLLIIFIRILSAQKFTELMIDVSLYSIFSNASLASNNNLYKTRKRLRLFFILVFLVILLIFSVFTYQNNSEILAGRLFAQAQLFWVIIKYNFSFLPDMDSMVREFSNFWGSNEKRLELFSAGNYYGIYTLMDISNTGRDLYFQAEKNTSASGSFPTMNIFLFGWYFGFFVNILTAFFVIKLSQIISILAVRKKNPLIALLGTLIIVRCYKYFLIGSPSYLYNIQFFEYVLLISIVLLIQIFLGTRIKKGGYQN